MDATGIRTFVGGEAAQAHWFPGVLGISLRLADGVVSVDEPAGDTVMPATTDVVLAIDKDLCQRTFGTLPSAPAVFHLPADMRVIGMSIRDCDLPGPAKQAFNLAKGIELLCSLSEKTRADALVPIGAGVLSTRDARRIRTARRIIDERWQEKLTLDCIARASGLNRAKLTSGFRSMFACSVADAIAERRMSGARDLVLETDLPISCIGYRCGYLNNASFARAFSRRFGLAPTRLRAEGIAA